MAAAHFKSRCLAVMDEVSETGEPVVVTKHGKPVAKLVSLEKPAEREIFGFMKGKGQIVGDILSTTPAEDWHRD